MLQRLQSSGQLCASALTALEFPPAPPFQLSFTSLMINYLKSRTRGGLVVFQSFFSLKAFLWLFWCLHRNKYIVCPPPPLPPPANISFFARLQSGERWVQSWLC